MSQLFASGGQSIGASASASVLPVNTHVWSPLGWTGWISLQSNLTVWEAASPRVAFFWGLSSWLADGPCLFLVFPFCVWVLSASSSKDTSHIRWAAAPQQERPPQWEAWAPQLESSPAPSPQQEKAHVQQRRPRAAKKKWKQKGQDLGLGGE